jgi:hypothetical protein
MFEATGVHSLAPPEKAKVKTLFASNACPAERPSFRCQMYLFE